MTAPPTAPRRAALRRALLRWWDAGRRDMPWRAPAGQADPYRTWVSEVMLQQTRVATAIPYYQRFLARWPTLEALASAAEEEVLASWSGLGYYARGRNLLAAARMARERHGGLPPDPADLGALPGFGPYTVGAVASIAFGVPLPALDGNAVRVLARLLAVEGDPRERPARERIEAAARALVPPRRPGDWNQALMELGATLCLPRRPACARCPVAALCEAYGAGRTGEIPPPRRRTAPRLMEMALARVERGGRLLLVRRPGRGLLGGLWELPGVEVPPGSGDAEAADHLRRALRPLGIDGAPRRTLAVVERLLTHRRLVLRVMEVPPPAAARRRRGTASGGSGEGTDGSILRWTHPAEMGRMAVSVAMRRAVESSSNFRVREPLTLKGRTV